MLQQKILRYCHRTVQGVALVVNKELRKQTDQEPVLTQLTRINGTGLDTHWEGTMIQQIPKNTLFMMKVTNVKKKQQKKFTLSVTFYHQNLTWCFMKQRVQLHITICNWPAAIASQSEHPSSPLLSSVSTHDQTTSLLLPRTSICQPVMTDISSLIVIIIVNLYNAKSQSP